jgi:hypothetical protein
MLWVPSAYLPGLEPNEGSLRRREHRLVEGGEPESRNLLWFFVRWWRRRRTTHAVMMHHSGEGASRGSLDAWVLPMRWKIANSCELRRRQ